MDPSLYHPNMPYAPPSGLPQESKLVTYMNRSASTSTRPLTQAMGALSFEDSPSSSSNQVREFIPMNYFAQPSMITESPVGSPPSVLSMGGMAQGPLMGGTIPPLQHIQQASHMGGMPQTSHMGAGMAQSSAHMGAGMAQSSAHMGAGMAQSSTHMGAGMAQPSAHMGAGMAQSSAHMGAGMAQSSVHMGAGMPQSSAHMSAGMPQSSLMNANMQQAAHMSVQPQMIHENVGGTTYFFPSDSINPSALNSSASLNASAEACMVGPPIMVPSPYTTAMYIPMTSTHMHPMPSKPGAAMGVAVEESDIMSESAGAGLQRRRGLVTKKVRFARRGYDEYKRGARSHTTAEVGHHRYERLFRKAMRACRRNQWACCWIEAGRILIRKDDHSEVTHIRSEEDIEQLFEVFSAQCL